ncbi:hypothetical protein ScPMuIL_010045 [Solemya velum]
MSSDEDQWELDDPLPDRGIKLERCLLGRSEVQIPETFIEQNHIFKDIMSLDTWENVLTEEQRQHLTKFLPSFPEEDSKQKAETIKDIFEDKNFKFGNPLKQFETKLRDGFFSPDIAKYASLCRRVKFREYKYRQQKRYSELLKEILLSRQQVFEQLRGLPPDEPLQYNYVPPVPKEKFLECKVKKKYIRLLREVREECGVEDTSSEEEECSTQKSKKQLFKSLCPIPSPEPTIPSVVSTFSPRPLPVVNGDTSNTQGNSTSDGDNTTPNSVKRGRPFSPVEVTEIDYKQMLKNHKRKKHDEQEFPELNTQNITLQDIMSRCQASKKASSSKSATSPLPGESSHIVKKKLKNKDQPNKKLKKTKSVKKDGSLQKISSPTHTESSIEVQDTMAIKEEDMSEFSLNESGPLKLTFPQYTSFFSLLRDLIIDFPEGKTSSVKLEEKVREWQESPTCTLNSWFSQQPDWVETVVSALKFLSGDLLGTQIENFVPYLDYKERAQVWRWIGVGRDSDEQMSTLCDMWIQTKPESTTEGHESGTTTPPPPRIRTSYVIRPTTEEEKDSFQEQEKSRFENPHKAFTYSMHGYDSVVGPVKGVYSKESAVTKAREHALLVSTRPSYVTILTLVRDSAARLPNGEGTRSDICELLKDSQFLAPGVSDAQINVVVSGALDRLHSEKDPCVKYDVNRKLWIYLHRNRSEEEFERIHQAQGAAVKAKKSLQKPKPIKSQKVKDLTSTLPTLSTSSPSLASLTPTSTNDSLTVDDTPPPSQTASQSQNSASPVATPSPSKLTAQSPLLGHVSPRGTGAGSPRVPSSPVPAALLKQLSANVSAVHNMNQLVTTSGTAMPSMIHGSASAAARLVQQAAKSSALAQAATGSAPRSPVTSLTSITTSIPQKRQDMPANKGLPFGLLQGQPAVRGISSASQGVPPNIVITTRPETLLQRQASMGLISYATPTNVQTTVTSATHAVVSATTSPQHTGSASGTNVSMQANSNLVARLVQQVAGNQVVSNLLAAQKVQNQIPKTNTIKIHGGKPIHLSSGKPVHLSGKPFSQAKGQLVQIGGKGHQSLGVIQTPQGALPTISIIPQGAAHNLVTVGQTRPAHTTTTTSGSVVSSILQAGVMASSHKPTGTSHIPIVCSGTSLLSQPGIQVMSQPKVVTPSQGGGIVVTQLAPGSITLRPGGVPASNPQSKMVTASQAGLVSQLIVQQSPQAGRSVATDQIPQGGVTTIQQPGHPRSPIIVSSAGGKPGQNIQVVRTVLSQHAGLKPGQATILISQPTLQHAGATVLPSGQIIQNPTKMQGKANQKGKAQPVYARIITPPPGMKLATVQGSGVSVGGQTVTLPGQPTPTQSVSVIQTVGKLLQSSAGICQPTTVTIGSPRVAGVEIADATAQLQTHVNITQVPGDTADEQPKG